MKFITANDETLLRCVAVNEITTPRKGSRLGWLVTLDGESTDTRAFLAARPASFERVLSGSIMFVRGAIHIGSCVRNNAENSAGRHHQDDLLRRRATNHVRQAAVRDGLSSGFPSRRAKSSTYRCVWWRLEMCARKNRCVPTCFF